MLYLIVCDLFRIFLHKALINHVDQGLMSQGEDRGFKSQGTNYQYMIRSEMVKDSRHQYMIRPYYELESHGIYK